MQKINRTASLHFIEYLETPPSTKGIPSLTSLLQVYRYSPQLGHLSGICQRCSTWSFTNFRSQTACNKPRNENRPNAIFSRTKHLHTGQGTRQRIPGLSRTFWDTWELWDTKGTRGTNRFEVIMGQHTRSRPQSQFSQQEANQASLISHALRSTCVCVQCVQKHASQMRQEGEYAALYIQWCNHTIALAKLQCRLGWRLGRHAQASLSV